MEKFEKSPDNPRLSESEPRILERTQGHLRTLKEQVSRTEWAIGEYMKTPNRDTHKTMMLNLELLTRPQERLASTAHDLKEAYKHENPKDSSGWPPGIREWSK